ncbi:MAG: NAD-dependent isocitrate dehydrogenase [Proteobacteria bacterium]|nr:NAD-dependent isocitrate dehydrogenase [Pseudomonadota bacterium]MBU1450352.1 NAD-dependent isocitrate dehydrogenase [Pseudomonadota bacterium]MBU2470341.1 NAD-dependent isocitrate dehydrogenase [Pseudomonadota bacterium]MBU2518488.1 NAD-dependent isocitrate dehydrogenase [Pseudomonadota bacterium]
MSKRHEIAVIGGDGVGPEVTQAALAVLAATGAPLNFTHYQAGDDCLEQTGQALPQATLDGALNSEAVLFGAAGASAADVILRLRAELKAWANLRPSKAYPGVDCLRPETDMMIVRENSEGMYFGGEDEPEPGKATATRVITDHASYRIARCAFEFAIQAGYGKVTAVHKVNVLKKTDKVFLDACRRAAAEFKQIQYEEALVDSVAMRMVMKPQDFQVIVTTNLFGDVLSDLAAGLIGGLGMCPSANLGDGPALFEPVHGTAPDIAGQGKANPTAAILCAAMMLRHLGYAEMAASVEAAVTGCLASGQTTADLGGSLGTMGMAQAVIARMGA